MIAGAIAAGVGAPGAGVLIGVALKRLVPYWAARSVTRRWPEIVKELDHG